MTTATVCSLVGFWVAIAAVGLGACIAIATSSRKDDNGLVAETAERGIVHVIVGPVIAALTIVVTSGGMLDLMATAGRGETTPGEHVSELTRRIHDSDGMVFAIAGVSILWIFALMSALRAIVIRRVQQRRSGTLNSGT